MLKNTLNTLQLLCEHFRLYKERLAQIDAKLEEMGAGRSQEYLDRLTQLQEQMHIRTQVSGMNNCIHVYTNFTKQVHCTSY